ncbi:unnamed protein product [Didymodactylos carnosus]|uniref:UvrD-like helicase C-terminal domain-containing protein n=1 Tax=Didymodactylos carnosus TaxID=1234261 RepID=A0A8S2QS15_9BILA|nr:unnamed protein product [Didymodactylos carnosus]CAF4119736.1 unnamed protein product [Didymodactylos carnosus]
MDENEDPGARKRRLARERKERWKPHKSQGTLDRIRTEEAGAKRLKRQLETSEQSQARQAADAESHQQRQQLETPLQSQGRRAANAKSHQHSHRLESPVQSQGRRAADAKSHQTPKKGLCNGTRMIVRDLHRNFITAEIISKCNRGDTVFIPRIDLAPSDTTLPFILRRQQFPIIPAYAITINKSQGQTFDHVGIDLKTAVFSHGQLYVALSRSRNPQQVKVRIQPNPQQGQLLRDEHQLTRDVVFKEVFQL